VTATPPGGATARVALVTGADERYADPEIEGVAAGLRDRGLGVEVVAWSDEHDWAAYPLVVVRSTWDYFDRLPEFVDWVTRVDRVTRLVNPADVIRWNTHKGYLQELGAKGVPTVPTRLVSGTSTDVADQVRECPWEEVILKLAVDGGARTLWRGRREDPGLSRVAERLAEQGDVLVQPFVPGIAKGERSLIFLGGRLSHAVRKVPAAGDYRSQRHLGGSEMAHEPDSAELQVALAAMAAAPGRLTYARVDVVDWEGSPCLMEMELVEPDLFFRGVPKRLDRYAEVLCAELDPS
jgi:glutathione synthase/RimK-type ligase-like ATP-grasp enzyme